MVLESRRRGYYISYLIIRQHAIEDIAKMEVDYLILGSYAYRQVFYENLDALNYQGKVIDLFSCLGDYIEDHYMDYKTVYQTKQEYLK